MRSEIPYANEVLARTCQVIDDLIHDHPEKALQAVHNSALQGWFAGKVMLRFGGLGDYGTICHMVVERLEKYRAALSDEVAR